MTHPGARVHPRAADARGLGLEFGDTVDGHRPRAAAAREDRGRPARRGGWSRCGASATAGRTREPRRTRSPGSSRSPAPGRWASWASSRSGWRGGVRCAPPSSRWPWSASLSVVTGVVGTARAMFISGHDLGVVLPVSAVAGAVWPRRRAEPGRGRRPRRRARAARGPRPGSGRRRVPGTSGSGSSPRSSGSSSPPPSGWRRRADGSGLWSRPGVSSWRG